MAGVSFFCALELAFANPRRESVQPAQTGSWRAVSYGALILFVLELLVCARMVTSSANVEVDNPQKLLFVLLSLTVMVMSFVAWMIPYYLKRSLQG